MGARAGAALASLARAPKGAGWRAGATTTTNVTAQIDTYESADSRGCAGLALFVSARAACGSESAGAGETQTTSVANLITSCPRRIGARPADSRRPFDRGDAKSGAAFVARRRRAKKLAGRFFVTRSGRGQIASDWLTGAKNEKALSLIRCRLLGPSAVGAQAGCWAGWLANGRRTDEDHRRRRLLLLVSPRECR